MARARTRIVLAGIVLTWACTWPARAQEIPAAPAGPSTPEAIREFLLRADVVRSRDVGKGITGIKRLTLEADGVVHDAAFQAVDERKPYVQFERGGAEVAFVDSYHYNIAGYELAVVLGLGHMVPVTVERIWRGQPGSLSWWVASRFDEGERLKQGVEPPNKPAWIAQVYRARVFAALIADTDRNVGNTLITDEWKVWMIDFTRAFRRAKEIHKPENLELCDRNLLARLEALSEDGVRTAVGRHLNRIEIEALLARRDLLVAHFRKLVAEKGEAAVLY